MGAEIRIIKGVWAIYRSQNLPPQTVSNVIKMVKISNRELQSLRNSL